MNTPFLERRSEVHVIDKDLLLEQLVGLTMASEVCARWLDRDVPDVGEVKALVDEMVAVSRQALALLAR